MAGSSAPRRLGQKCHEGHQHARRAEAALQAVLVAERLLKRMECAVGRRKSFDCDECRTVSLNGKHEARSRWHAIDDDGAGSAYAMLAAEMSPGQAEILTKKIAEVLSHFNVATVADTVDGQGDLSSRGHGFILRPFPPRGQMRAASASQPATCDSYWRRGRRP